MALKKAVKNETELQGMGSCHIRDGAAKSHYLCWLQRQVESGAAEGLTEITMADRLEQFRSTQDLFQGLSFETITSLDANGADIHYVPLPEACKTLSFKEQKSHMYLCN
eukprot:Platyproteum_vivax@DN7644_c0_g1_i13.p2